MSEHTRIKQEIQESIHHFSTLLEIPPPNLAFSSNRNFGGHFYKNVVTLNQPIIENWDNERKMCEFVLVHELVHAKFNESSISEGFKSFLIPSVSVKFAFSELRANTLAYEITGSNELELNQYFSEFYYYPKVPFIAYSGGYLKGDEYVEFISKHQKWTAQTIKEASIYFKRYSLWYMLVPEGKYLELQQKFS